MDKLVNILRKIDRRVVYLVVFLSIILPFIPGFGFLKISVKPQKEARAVFDYIESLKPGDAIYLDFSFGPSLKAEIIPAYIAVVKHAFKKDLRVFTYYSDIQGINLGKKAVKDIVNLPAFSDKVEGVDYLHVEFIPIGLDLLIMNMCSDFKGTLNREGQIFEGLNTLKDLKYIICFTGSGMAQYWEDMQLRFGYTAAVAVTAVLGPDHVPYLQTRQINGMINGMRGSADYETLLEEKYGGKGNKTPYIGTATRGMASLTLSHLVIFGFIALGNFIYFYDKRKKKRGAR